MDRARDPKKIAEHESELACPAFPMPLLHVWTAFNRLSNRRGSNGFSINPITWPEIDAFVRHSKMPLAPWEISIIEELDNMLRAEHAKPKE